MDLAEWQSWLKLLNSREWWDFQNRWAIFPVRKMTVNVTSVNEEAVEQALEDAVFDHVWNEKARARLLFMVLDAPPHNTAKIKEKLTQTIQSAASQGIRIIPVVSSGIDTETEFLLRSFGISTGGTYVFLTDHSGIGNDHLEPTVGQYNVEFLNDLLVKIINRYIK